MSWLSAVLAQPGAQRLGWALVHFVWQGTAAAVVLAAALEPQPVARDWAAALLNARVVEVRTFGDSRAAVIAHLPGETIVAPFDVRCFVLVDGQWLNTGDDRFPALPAARAKADAVLPTL
jgi:hypothetical protein